MDSPWRRLRGGRGPWRPCCAAGLGLEGFLQSNLQSLRFERLFRQQRLQFAVFLFKITHTLGLFQVHALVFTLPAGECLLAYVVPQADLIVAKATISFSEDTDDLFYGMTLFLSDKKIISLEMGQFIGSQTGAAPFGTALSRRH